MDARIGTARPYQPAGRVLGHPIATGPSPREVVERYFASERRLDPAAAADCFAEDAVLVEPNGRRHTGRPAIRAFYESLYASLEQLQIWVVNEVPGGSSAAIEWHADITNRAGTTHLRGVNVVEVRDGHLAEARIYFAAATSQGLR